MMKKPNALFPPKTKLNQLNSTSTFDIDRYNITFKNQLKRFTIKLFKMYKFTIKQTIANVCFYCLSSP